MTASLLIKIIEKSTQSMSDSEIKMATASVSRADLNQIHSVTSNFEDLHIRSKEKRKDDGTGIDISKILEPPKRKLTSIESQRIVSVVDDVIRKVEIVTLLPYITENLDRLSVLLGSELVRQLREYDRAQSEYTRVLREHRRASSASQTRSRPVQMTESHERDDGESVASGNQGDSTQGDRKIFEILRHSNSLVADIVRNIVRLFGQNPAALNSIRLERKERTFEANNLVDELISLKDQVFYRLVTSPGEEVEREKQLADTMAREEKARTTIKKLEMQLETAIKEKDNEIAKKNDEIRNLKTAIHNVEKSSEDQSRKLITEAAKGEAAELKNSEGKKSKLQQELIQLKQSLQSNLTAHRESELTLRKRKYKMETEVENWIQKFDNDMSERQDEFDELDVIYAEEKKQLNELETRFKTLEEEYLTIMEERRIAREKREQAERELRQMIKAATVIQSLWRAFRMRKALKAKKKKKGKKGKKGKGRSPSRKR